MPIWEIISPENVLRTSKGRPHMIPNATTESQKQFHEQLKIQNIIK